MVIPLLAVVLGVLCVLAGFVAGWTYAHRRLPDLLARLTPQEIRALAEATAQRKTDFDTGRRLEDVVARAEAHPSRPPSDTHVPDGAQLTEAVAHLEQARRAEPEQRTVVPDGAAIGRAVAAVNGRVRHG